MNVDPVLRLRAINSLPTGLEATLSLSLVTGRFPPSKDSREKGKGEGARLFLRIILILKS